MAGIGIGDFRGDVVEYIKAAMAISSMHYPGTGSTSITDIVTTAAMI